MNEINNHAELQSLLKNWTDTAGRTKEAFSRLLEKLRGTPDLSLDFVARPGVTYSLRAKHTAQTKRDLFTMVDIIDDDPSERWLSVCFYGDFITDPEENGDFVPEGLLGEDACCFDIEELDETLVQYVEARLDEAYANAPKIG